MITFCLMTSGEETELECLQSIKHFKNKICFQEVRNVSPQIKALNQMIDQCTTEWLVPLDADILLFRNAYERIEHGIERFGSDPMVYSILFKLYDTLTDREILALKVLKTSVLKQFPFKESATPDVEHFQRLKDAGYICIDRLLVKNPIGEHVVKGKHFCYHKYRDVYQTLKSHKYQWDNAVFMGGKTLLEKSKAHFDFFVKSYLIKENDDYLWCIAGMLDGIESPVEHRSKNLSTNFYRYSKKDVIDAYWEYYSLQQEKFELNPFF